MKRFITALSLVLALAAGACATDGDDADGTGAPDDGDTVASVTVGSADFTESRILGEIYAGALEEAGHDVERKLGIGARDVYIAALEDGEIDVIPEYTGNLLRFVTDEQDAPDTADETYEALTEALEEEGDLAVLEPSDAEDKDGVVVTQETADRLELEKVSDLADHQADLVFGGPAECETNPACLQGLRDVYGLTELRFTSIQAGPNLVNALKAGEVDAANIFSTDGAIAANDFVVLTDDKRIAGAQNVVPLVRAEISEDIAEALNAVSEALTTEDLTELNKRVDIDKEDPEDVAADWLEENDLG